MNATGNFNQGRRHSPAHRLDFPSAMPQRLEFEELDDFAGDAAYVTQMIERDGSVAPDLGSFDLD